MKSNKHEYTFNHGLENISLACGISEERRDEILKSIDNARGKFDKCSEVVEYLAENFDHVELAFAVIFVDREFMNFRMRAEAMKAADKLKEMLMDSKIKFEGRFGDE